MTILNRNSLRRLILLEMENTQPSKRNRSNHEVTQQQYLYRKKKNNPFDPNEQTEWTANPEYDFGLDDFPDIEDDFDPPSVSPEDTYKDDISLEDSVTLRRNDPVHQPFTKGFAGITPEFEERERARRAGTLPYQDLPAATVQDYADAAGVTPAEYQKSLLTKIDDLERKIRESIRRGISKRSLLKQLVELKACQTLHEQTLTGRRY